MKWTPKTVAIAAAVVVVGGWYLKKKAGETLQEVGQAVNPTNPDNVINQGFNSVYKSVTGSEGTLGTDLADFFHGLDEED